jgi:hypothetical protein
MPVVAFDHLPPDARVWVFAASRPLTPDEQAQVLAPVDAYLAQWKAHGAPLTCARDMRHERFLAIGVDERAAGASGCSVDALFRQLQQLERVLGTPLVQGGRVFWRMSDGAVHAGSRDEFARAAARGDVTADTQVFDTTITTRAAWTDAFEAPARATWHAQLLAAAP